MKITDIKYVILILSVCLGVNGIGLTGATFSDKANLADNEVSTGCWAAPTVPEQVYPSDETIAGIGSAWLDNPYMEWTDSTTTCPLGDVVLQYEYQSYHDVDLNLNSLAYSSGLLGASMIPAPGTPDGTYYWRVRAYDGHTYSAWSDTWLLTVDRSVQVAAAGDVVINEVMWMGSTGETNDEWIELRNMTDQDIEIGKWTIENAKSGNGTYMIPNNNTIPAHGYFLISNYPATSANSNLSAVPDIHSAGLNFKNDSGNGNLVLKDEDENVIDEAKGDSWPAGENGDKKKSMERNADPGDGALAGSWHTCDSSSGCTDVEMVAYWDSGSIGHDYGTPKGANLSENDPTVKRDDGGLAEKSITAEPPLSFGDEVGAGEEEQEPEGADLNDGEDDGIDDVAQVAEPDPVLEDETNPGDVPPGGEDVGAEDGEDDGSVIVDEPDDGTIIDEGQSDGDDSSAIIDETGGDETGGEGVDAGADSEVEDEGGAPGGDGGQPDGGDGVDLII